MTQEGKFVNATHGGSSYFNFSLLCKDGVLAPGKYVVQVDPTWDSSADLDEDYKKILIDVYSTEKNIKVKTLSHEDGVPVFHQALKDVA